MHNLKEYIKSLLRPDSKDSIKSLAMFLSVIIMCILSIGVLGCIIYEVVCTGHIVTSLIDYGVFEVMLGGMVLGGSIPKMVTDKAKIGKMGEIAEEIEETIDSVENNESDDEIVEEEKPKRKKKKE